MFWRDHQLTSDHGLRLNLTSPNYIHKHTHTALLPYPAIQNLKKCRYRDEQGDVITNISASIIDIADTDQHTKPLLTE